MTRARYIFHVLNFLLVLAFVIVVYKGMHIEGVHIYTFETRDTFLSLSYLALTFLIGGFVLTFLEKRNKVKKKKKNKRKMN